MGSVERWRSQLALEKTTTPTLEKREGPRGTSEKKEDDTIAS